MKKQSKQGQNTSLNQKHKEKEKPESEIDTDMFYTKEEIELLDKYHDFTGHKFEDEEIYDVMVKYNNDDALIKDELKEMIKETMRGDEFNWQKIGESKFLYINIIIIFLTK